jgi:membrane protein implicated in regulation of membrane protease activity
MDKRLGFSILLVVMYLYTLTFDIFLTSLIRVPAPIVFCLPLIFLFSDPVNDHFRYTKEMVIFFIAGIMYFLIGMQNITSFFAVMIVITFCALYFNYFIAGNRKRFDLSVWIFYSLLSVSGIILLLDHQFKIPEIRSFLAGDVILQSPSGISTTMFNYGYQAAALSAFLAVATAIYSKSFITHLLSIALCILLIFYGMQRSVLVAFGIGLMVFWIFYYRYRTVLMIGMFVLAGIFSTQYLDRFSSDKQQNILSKNQHNKDDGEKREGLIMENLEVISDYPFGLIISGKSWNDVVKNNLVYKSGEHVITSHNAYLMFITYVGIVGGILFLYLIYRKVISVIWLALKNIYDKDNALLICLGISFISISLNSFFHNGWLLGGSGPTLFLYFSILHLDGIKKEKLSKIVASPLQK